jgi:hypothetical protein
MAKTIGGANSGSRITELDIYLHGVGTHVQKVMPYRWRPLYCFSNFDVDLKKNTVGL